MMHESEGIYIGKVVHKRLRPREHALSYSVFSILFDCDRLTDLDRRLWLFSHNRFNIFCLFDRDHGDGTPLAGYLRAISARAGYASIVQRFTMLCYPRILGYAFNPLTVYFGFDVEGRVRLVIYEVNNTFGERMSYVLPANPDENGVITQSCDKRLYVSPFNTDTGKYSFRVTSVSDDLTVGVALKVGGVPLLKAHFRGTRTELTDAGLLAAIARTGWMTIKVIAGIHIEAARLWLKGMRIQPRPRPPRNRISFGAAARRGSRIRA